MARRLNARLLRSHRLGADNPGIVQVAQPEQSARPSLVVVRLKAHDERAAFVTQRPHALRSLSKRGRASTDRERRRAVIGITIVRDSQRLHRVVRAGPR